MIHFEQVLAILKDGSPVVIIILFTFFVLKLFEKSANNFLKHVEERDKNYREAFKAISESFKDSHEKNTTSIEKNTEVLGAVKNALARFKIQA